MVVGSDSLNCCVDVRLIMKVLVSDKKVVYNEWVLVRKLEDVMNLSGNIDYLVFNRSGDAQRAKMKLLSDIFKKYINCKIIYLCSKDSVDYDIKMLITGGLSGSYVDDEFYLESDRELNNLILNLPHVSKLSELAGTDVVSNFFDRFMNDAKPMSKGYLSVVKDAVSDIISSYNDKNLENIKMSETAADIFNNSIDTIAQMKENIETVKSSLETYKVQQEDLAKFTMSKNDLAVTYSPRVFMPGKSSLICIKDVDNCAFLTSFMLGFRRYLESVRNVRPKLIFIKNNNELLERKYSQFNWVTKKNNTNNANYYGDVVFTDYPISKIVSKLLSDTGYDTFIVVDSTSNFIEHIVNSNCQTIYVTSGKSSIDMFNLQVNSCFTCNRSVNVSLFKIPYFENYPEREDLRVNLYLSECSKFYDILFERKSL